MSISHDEILDGFTAKINKLRRYDGYKYFFGKKNRLEFKRFGDIEGPLYRDGFIWPFESQEVWFKGEVIMPEKVAGITVTGSAAALAHMSACPSLLFVNGQKKVDEKWWINTEIKLSDSLNPNDVFDITINFRKFDGNTFFGIPQIFIDKVESIFLSLDGFFKTIEFLKRLIDLGEITDKRHIDIYGEVCSRIPLDLLKEERTMEFMNYLTEAETSLQPFSPYLKKYCSYMAGHAHIDMNWLWDWKNTLDTARRTFIQVKTLMEQYPEFCFSQSQAALYKAMEDNYPEVFECIKKMISRGQWDVTASTWVEGDLNMASGEALIRQSLLAKRYTREKFGVESRVCWSPDTFGHSVSYPQILKKCGIDYYYFCRCAKGTPIFYWEGIDGSRVLAFNDPAGYNGVVTAELTYRFDNSIGKNNRAALSAAGFVDSLKAYNIKNSLFSYGVGDHGGGPTIRDIENGLTLKNKSVFTRVRFSTTERFFDEIKKEMKDIPVIKGELNYIFEGCYTTHADIKKYNRQCENLLVTAEIFASLASLYGFNYPSDNIKQAWQNTCFNQFHDILDGSAIHLSYDYSRQLAEQSIDVASRTLNHATKYISSLISFPQKKDDGIPVVVFNSLSWTRDDIAEVSLSEIDMDYAVVKDTSGNVIQSQVFGDKLFFNAFNVPSLGYKTYFIHPQASPRYGSEESRPAKIETVFENNRYRLEIDPATAGIKTLFNKEHNKDLIKSSEQGNIFKLYREMAHGMSAWDIGRIDSVRYLLKNTKIMKVVKGPVMDVIETECRFEKSHLSQQILFFKHLDKIEFRTGLSWHEKGGPETGIPMLRVSFPLEIMSETSVYEIPFAAVQRPNNAQEAPALKWLDYSDGRFGLALLNNCKYGYNVRGNEIELTIIRSPYEPDLDPDSGEYSFSYALYPHLGNWQEAHVSRKGYELNMPLIPVLTDNSNSNGDTKFLPFEKSFIEVDVKNIIISCFKKADDLKGFIIHLYESEGKVGKGDLYLNWDINSAEETNLIEDSISSANLVDNKLRCEFRKWEIKSYRLIPNKKSR